MNEFNDNKFVDKKKFERDGYLAPAGKLDVSGIRELYEKYIMNSSRDERAKGSTSFNHFRFFDPSMNPHYHSEKIWNLIMGQKIKLQITKILGEDIVCLNSIFIAKPPRSRHYLAPHQDAIFWGLEKSDAISAWIAITDSSLSNGCMIVYPKTHHQTYKHTIIKDPDNILQMGECCISEKIKTIQPAAIELKTGEFSIHHCQIIHESKENESDSWRIGLIGRYARRSSLNKAYLDSQCYTEFSLKDRETKKVGPQKPSGDFQITRETMLKNSRFTRQYYRFLNEKCIEKAKLSRNGIIQ